MGNSNGKPVVFTDSVNLDHFRLLRVVGKGAFGKVRIVERKDTGLTFALKYIRKDEVVRSESVRNMIRERRMLEHLNHPFLCNLRYSFQDVEYLYIVVDLMTGGDLRFHITRKAFTEDAIRFWMAELGCALRYVHGQGIVHRDVKPDNVLLDSDGHLHLTDFNVATDIVPGRVLTSKSGTLAYLAPEVYRGKGYLSEVDWWSMGVLFYECIYNKRPFEGHHHEQLATAIMKGEPHYPVTNPPVSRVCMHAISSLLEKDKTQRIGAASWESFTDNPFFREIDFVALEKKEVEPVFRPSSEKTNFDATYDLEELLLEEAPLEARTRKQKPRAGLRADASEAEIRADELHRMIETMFEPFNYKTLPETRIPVAPDVVPVDPNERPIPAVQSSQSANTPRSQTPAVEKAHSRAPSPNGSPPLPTGVPTPNKTSSPPTSQEYFPAPDQLPVRPGPSTLPEQPFGSQQQPSQPSSQQQLQQTHQSQANSPQVSRDLQQQKLRAIRYDDTVSPPPQSRDREISGASQSQRSTPNRARGSTKQVSAGGGTQVTLNESGSWSDMANSSKGMIVDDKTGQQKPNGMLGFLSRKKGRDRSPKARERGVLGKEGARTIVGN